MGQFCPPGDIWQCLEKFLVATAAWGGGQEESSTGIEWLEVRDATKHHTISRTDTHKKGLSDKSVQSAEVEER